jgi:hypothetical protein
MGWNTNTGIGDLQNGPAAGLAQGQLDFAAL